MNVHSQVIFILLSLFTLSSCTTIEAPLSHGIQPGFEAYIPARIAVLPCRTFPANARYPGLKPSNIKEKENKAICETFDQKIIEGFTNQPFMKGFTPALIQQFLEKNSATQLLPEIDQLWTINLAECSECTSGPSVYNKLSESSPKWRGWLNQFSKNTRYSDAILLPLISEAVEQKKDERGVWISERFVKIELFLIDTNHGKLLWSGSRAASVSNQTLRESVATEAPPFPHWNRLFSRLFTEAIWKDFPGRQMNF